MKLEFGYAGERKTNEAEITLRISPPALPKYTGVPALEEVKK
jgi:hypothetical protein